MPVQSEFVHAEAAPPSSGLFTLLPEKTVFLLTGVWWGVGLQLMVYSGVAAEPLAMLPNLTWYTGMLLAMLCSERFISVRCCAADEPGGCVLWLGCLRRRRRARDNSGGGPARTRAGSRLQKAADSLPMSVMRLPPWGGCCSSLDLVLASLCDWFGTVLTCVGLTLAGSAIFGIVYSSVSCWAALFSWLLLGRSLAARQWAGIAVVTVGLAGSCTADAMAVGDDVILGTVLIAVGTIAYGLEFSLCERLLASAAPAAKVGLGRVALELGEVAGACAAPGSAAAVAAGPGTPQSPDTAGGGVDDGDGGGDAPSRGDEAVTADGVDKGLAKGTPKKTEGEEDAGCEMDAMTDSSDDELYRDRSRRGRCNEWLCTSSDTRDAVMDVETSMWFMGWWGLGLSVLYIGVYTVPRWEELVAGPTREAGNTTGYLVALFGSHVIANWLHNTTWFAICDAEGSVATGLLQGLKSVVLFCGSSLAFCHRQESQCLTTPKAISTVVVTIGTLLFFSAPSVTPRELLERRAAARRVDDGDDPLLETPADDSPPSTPKRGLAAAGLALGRAAKDNSAYAPLRGDDCDDEI